jgi:hypothetical protein
LQALFEILKNKTILPLDDSAVFELIVKAENLIIFGKSDAVNALNFILRGDSYDA